MALQPQLVPIPFAQGVDTKSDPKQVPVGKLLSLFNGVFQSAKRILKRFGYTKKSQATFAGATITSGISLKSYKDEMDLYDGHVFYSYSKVSDKWRSVGLLSSPKITGIEVVSGAEPIGWCDSAYNSAGYYGYVYITRLYGSHSMFVVVQDASTGAIIINTQLAGAGVLVDMTPKIVALGNYFVIVYKGTLDTELKYIAVNLSNPTGGMSPVTITSDLDNTIGINFDTTVVNGNMYLVYASTGATKIAFYYLTPSLVLSARLPSSAGTSKPRVGVAIAGDSSNNIWMTYVDTVGPKLAYSVYSEFIASNVVLDTTIATSAELSNAQNVGIVTKSTSAYIFTSINPTQPLDSSDQFIERAIVNISGAITTPLALFVRSVFMTGNPVLHVPSDTVYLPTVYTYPYIVPPSGAVGPSNPLQPTFFIFDENKNPVAKILSGTAAYTATTTFNGSHNINHTNRISANLFEFASIQATNLGSVSQNPVAGDYSVAISGTNVIKSGIAFNEYVNSAVLANDLLLSGSRLWMYDGNSVVENGFDIFPDYLSLVGTSGGAMTAGTYQYSAIYEWVDARGNHHRSAPSPVFTTTLTTETAVLVTVPNLRVTYKTDVIISLYRSSANGSILRRVTGSPMTSSTFNDPLADSVTITDKMDDVGQACGDILYTTGGEVENIAPPACTSITTYRSRLVLLPSEVTSSFWYSKEVIPQTPVEMSDLFVQNIDELGGNLTSAIQMDDKLVLFKSRNIFYMTGQGPSISGANNDFSTPLLVNSDVGCSNQQSLILMPNGVMFKSDKGIYLLDRSMQASYIGAPVEFYNPQTVTSSQLMEDKNQVRFTLDNGVTLVYDYYFDQWSVFTNISAVDSCIFENKFTYLKSDGSVLEESTGYTDDGAFIPLSLVTSWISMAGMQGFQRIYKALLLGEQKGNHTLRVKVRRDFDSTILQTDDIDATAISPAVYQWRVFPKVQKCEAIQLEMTDVQTSGFNEGFSISDLTLEIGIKTGGFKLPASQSSS